MKTELLTEMVTDLENTFVIGDTHFDHHNIIRYCNRPFNSVEQMNRTMVKNWNNTVRRKDKVYFLGDMAYGRGSRPASHWLEKLNGNITYIWGSHDRDRTVNYKPYVVLGDFFLTHSPWQIPIEWDGWIIHGHVHNHRPLIDRINRRVNVSVEAINYTPISLAKIFELTGQPVQAERIAL